MSDRDESHSSLYLINKKLVDLNKVVSIVEYNKTSLINGINTIKKRYYDEFTNVFNDHANIMKNILDELQYTRNKAEEEIKNQYKSSLDMLRLKLLSIQDSLKDDLLSNLVQLNSDIEKTAEFVQKCLDEFNNEIKVLNNYNQDGFNNIINNAKEKMKDQLLLLDDESKSKYETLIEDNKKRLNLLDSTFQKAVTDLKKKFFMTSKNQKKFEYAESFQSDSTYLLSLLDENKNQIFKLQREYRDLLVNYKSQIKTTIEEISYLSHKFQDEIQETEKSNDLELKRLNEFLSQIKGIQRSELERLNERLNEIKNSSTGEIESLRNEFDAKSHFFNSATELSNEQIEELNNQLNSDFTNLKQKYEEEESRIKSKLGFIVFTPDKDPDDYYFRLKELKKMHSKEVDFFNKQYQNEILDINNNFFEERKKIQNLIDLKTQIKETKENFEIELKKFDAENDIFLTEFKNQLESEQINERNRLEEENNLFLADLDLKIKDCNEENRKTKFNRITELENQRLSFITHLKHDFQSDKVNDSFISNYHEEYKKLNDNLLNFDVTLSQSKLTKDDIEKEKAKLKEIEMKNENEKNEILKMWQAQINSENDRHQKFLQNNKLSSDDETSTKLNNEIADIRLLYLNRLKEKDAIFSELQIKFNDLQKFEINLDTPDLDEKIMNLREELAKIKIELIERINSEEEASKSQFYSPIENQIKEQQNKNFQNLEVEKRKIEIEITELAKNVNDEQSRLTETIYNKNKSINREILSFQLNEQKMKNDHVKSVDDITSEIIKAKNELNELLNGSFDDLLSQKEKKFSMVQNAAIMQNKKEIDKLANHKKAIEKELNIKLKKMNIKCQEIRNLYNSRETRPEEQKIIDRFEGILETKSHALTSSLKEMMAYRAHLQAQEDLYNTRFGNSPKIGIATLKHRASSQIAKNLPPL